MKISDVGMRRAADARIMGPVQGRKFTPAAREVTHARMRRSSPSLSYIGSIAGIVTRKVTAPEPSRWISRASNAVPGTMRVGRPPAAQDAVDDRVEHACVGHDSEIQDRENEHACDGCDIPDSVDDELPGLQAEAAKERCDRRDRDERDQGGHPLAEDYRQQRQDRDQAENRVHGFARLCTVGVCLGQGASADENGRYLSTSLASASAIVRAPSSGKRNPALTRASTAFFVAAT